MTPSSAFDPKEGRLQLSLSCIAALPALVRGDSVERQTLEELVQGGIVVEGALHSGLVQLARCIAEPHVRVRLEKTSSPAFHADAWLDDRLGVLLRTSATEMLGDVVAVPRGMVAFRLARLLELGPRRRVKVTDPLELDEGLVETLLAPGDGLTGSQIGSLVSAGDQVIPEWLDVLEELSASRIARWRVGAWWNSQDESPRARSLEVAESDAGSFLIVRRRRPERRYRRAALYPLTSTQIWRLLCALVPPAEEVIEPLGN